MVVRAGGDEFLTVPSHTETVMRFLSCFLVVSVIGSTSFAQNIATWSVSMAAPTAGTQTFNQNSASSTLTTSLSDQGGLNPWNQAGQISKSGTGPYFVGGAQVATTSTTGSGRQNSQITTYVSYFERFQVLGQAQFNPFSLIESSVEANANFTGGVRSSVQGSVGFRLYRRTGSTRVLLSTQANFFDINEIGVVSQGNTLGSIALPSSTYEVEMNIAAIAQARLNGGLGTAKALQSYDGGFFFSEINGSILTANGYLTSRPSMVPEPTTMAGLGLAALALIRRKKSA